jgi:ribosomal protein S18 acetylase RimI-like enzyme
MVMGFSSYNFPAGYRLESASWRDLLAVHRLEQAVFTSDAYGYFELAFLLLWPGLKSLKLLSDSGAMVGFVSGGSVPGGGKTWIMTIGVHPAYQRRGLAWRLLMACEELLDAPTIFLTVRASNERAIRLYQQNGYRRFRLKHDYYPGGETGIEMRKDRV